MMTRNVNSSPIILEARDLHKTFTNPVSVNILKGVSVTLHAKQSIAIMGASGQGKSTLLQILGTLEAPSKGTLTILGQNANRFTSPRLRCNHIGFVFQAYHLLDDYTVLQNILMPAQIAGYEIHKQSASYARAWDLLSKVGLSQRANFSTKLLSGGEKQRVAIARALCNDPAILLADEPSGNLDEHTSRTIHELLLQCVRDLSKGLIVVTHNRAFAELCDRLYTLHEGILI